MFLSLPYPDLLVRGADPAPDPSITFLYLYLSSSKNTVVGKTLIPTVF